MKNFTIRTMIFTIFLLLFQIYSASAQYTEGVFVLNEGGAGSGNASVSFINNGAVTNNIYGTQNPENPLLGDTAQSISFNGDFAYPVKLEDGFFLDRRGVTPQSGFLSWTYYEYSRFEKTPSPVELLNKMLNNDPFTEMYDCGTPTQYKDMVNELNQKIKAGKFSDFRRLK